MREDIPKQDEVIEIRPQLHVYPGPYPGPYSHYPTACPRGQADSVQGQERTPIPSGQEQGIVAPRTGWQPGLRGAGGHQPEWTGPRDTPRS